MYRPQNQSRFYESSYHEENPFFRETITIIDECTKLMKDDRIFLRNRIKEHLKELKENRQREDEWENEQVQLLLQIFVEANKKKSLNKIQRGDKVMDWLQIKLRKFIDNNKKERHRKEVESFHKVKGFNPRRQLDSHMNFERSLERSRQRVVYNGPKFTDQLNKLSFNLEPKKKTTLPKYSLSKSNEKSPEHSKRKISQRQQFSNMSFYKQFDYLKKTNSKEKQHSVKQTNSSLLKNQNLINEIRPTSSYLTKLNRSLDTHKFMPKSIDRAGSSKTKQRVGQNFIKTKHFKEIPAKNELTRNEIDKLTELFTHHLNSQEETKKSPKPVRQVHPQHPDKNFKPVRENPLNSLNSLPSEGTSEPQMSIGNHSNRYEASSQKIQAMLRSSKEILSQYERQQENYSKYCPNEPIPPEKTFPKTSSNEDLFTPPDFLAECRKYMFSSHKKKTEEEGIALQHEENYTLPHKQTTFSDILNESMNKSFQKAYKPNPFGINETISQNASANLSVNKPESEVHFHYRNSSLTSVESLLKQIFKYSHKVTLDRNQIGEIMSKCNPQIEQLFQRYCDVLSLQSKSYIDKLSFDFVAVVKYFYTLGKVLTGNKDYFCVFLSEILDIRKKGYIDEEDIQSFFESLESSELQGSILAQIHSLLSSVFRSSCEVQSGGIMTHWSIYYLELRGEAQLQSLRELLNKFEFQVDQEGDQ